MWPTKQDLESPVHTPKRCKRGTKHIAPHPVYCSRLQPNTPTCMLPSWLGRACTGPPSRITNAGATNHAPCEPSMTPPGLLGSIGPSLLTFILHRPWSIGMNLSLDLHRTPSAAMSHPTPAHHKPRATSTYTTLSITHHPRVTTIGPQMQCKM